VKSLENGEVLGIVGIPFFGSKQRYEKRVIDVLSKIMQAFAFILIGLLAISYFSARTLTAPLRLIRQKIRQVSFQENNEPLDYVSDDEIGLLVSEYNKMLVTLEESKQALSKKEKESAWREMAKQVAHEIKNPLTPMKLNIQQLERLLGNNEERTKRTIRTLLNQIDTLSEIATSFSNFAEMPIPKEEIFDVATALRQVVHLHDNPKKVKLISEIPDSPVLIIGDKQLLGRVFNNLIINGIQSIPTEKEPKVNIKLSLTRKTATVCIRDNGSGIPEDIQEKVFVPNFTTKTSGSGIGLAISKRAIEHLGGKIWFETKINEGTTFYIEMPLMT
jgi:signal transduction histidine kinase